MKHYHINIGDIVTANHPSSFECLGLGSCIGLFLQDRLKSISGAAHIFLPDPQVASQIESPGKYYDAHSAINELVRRFEKLGSNLNALRAKLTGGADVLGGRSNSGLRNLESVLSLLTERRIFIAARDIGGTIPRSALFNSHTGEMIVRNSITRETKIF